MTASTMRQWATADTFRSFRARNFQLWFVGQTISMIGYFGQTVAQALLVLDLTHNGTLLGLVGALQFVPMLIFGPWAGVLSDRLDKRHLMVVTQTAMMVFALVLGALVLTGWVNIGWIIVLAMLSGTAWAFDQPCRRTIVTELVPDSDAANAVNLNGALFQLAKTVGPLLAAVTITCFGLGWCFVLNGISSFPAVVLLLKLRPTEMRRPELVKRGKGQVMDSFRYVRADITVWLPLAMLATASILAFNWAILLPLLAQRDLHGGTGTFAVLTGSLAAGALLGSLWGARRKTFETRFIAMSCVWAGASTAVLAGSPNSLAAYFAAALVGACSMLVVNATSASIQMTVTLGMRGRVTALLSMALFAGVVIGGPISGWVADHFGARTAIGLGGLGTLAAGGVVLAYLGSTQRATTPNVAPLNAD